LQELSHTWANGLLPFFFKRGYHVISAHYGNKGSNYMGVALAYPSKKYEALEVQIVRVADAFKFPDKPKRSRFLLCLLWFPNLLLGLFRKEKFCPWTKARDRFNQLAMAKLRHLQTGDTFWVATYHMPCLYGSPEKRQTMILHSYMALKLLQAKANGEPYVLMGDFNFNPTDSSYRYLTEGKIDKSDPDCPILPRYGAKVADEWRLDSIKPVKSAYAVVNGREPDFTNYAWTHSEQFTGTLDYIFFSDGWKPESVLPLMAKSELQKIESFPTATEPSDHVLIGARLNLV